MGRTSACNWSRECALWPRVPSSLWIVRRRPSTPRARATRDGELVEAAAAYVWSTKALKYRLLFPQSRQSFSTLRKTCAVKPEILADSTVGRNVLFSSFHRNKTELRPRDRAKRQAQYSRVSSIARPFSSSPELFSRAPVGRMRSSCAATMASTNFGPCSVADIGALLGVLDVSNEAQILNSGSGGGPRLSSGRSQKSSI